MNSERIKRNTISSVGNQFITFVSNHDRNNSHLLVRCYNQEKGFLKFNQTMIDATSTKLRVDGN